MENNKPRKDYFFTKIDNWHLEILGIFVIAVLLFPIVFLCVRDGNGSAIFPFHDQLDETILNYHFTAQYYGEKIYPQMMCGVPAESLKPFCPIFLPLYMLFSVYTAFEIQYAIVIATAFLGMYYCVKKLTGSSVSAAISATLFACLPVHSIYGNIVMGTPLLVFAILELEERKKRHTFVGIVCLIYYGLSTSFVLSGWEALSIITLFIIIRLFVTRQLDKALSISLFVLLVIYVVCNLDLFIEVFSSKAFVSHRVEHAIGAGGVPFLKSFLGLMTSGEYVYEAETKHEFLFIPILVALIFIVFVKRARNHIKEYAFCGGMVLLLAFLSAILGTRFVIEIESKLPGMLSSLNLTRYYYYIPGIMYIWLGVACAVIIKSIPDKISIFAYLFVVALCTPSLLHVIKDHNGTFYQNVNQVNNGQSVTGYMTMKNIYSNELMESIKKVIGEDTEAYRVINIGISPVVSLMNGFYTLDGYSNNYSVDYKHKFREIISDELELNDYNKAYFDLWGNRCYAFYHEWGNAYMLGNGFAGKIDDLHLNFELMKEMNCRYIFSAGEICDCEKYDLVFVGDFSDNISFWHIWVYEVK